jgi:hypothetical protein
LNCFIGTPSTQAKIPPDDKPFPIGNPIIPSGNPPLPTGNVPVSGWKNHFSDWKRLPANRKNQRNSLKNSHFWLNATVSLQITLDAGPYKRRHPLLSTPYPAIVEVCDLLMSPNNPSRHYKSQLFVQGSQPYEEP